VPGRPDASAGDALAQPDAADEGGLDASTGGDAAIEANDAPPTPLPLLVDLGGPKLTAPRVVTVSFTRDDATLVPFLQGFDDAVTTTAWWDAVASEYGVGHGSGGGHVVLPMTAASGYTDSVHGGDSSVRQLIQAAVSDGTLPAPDAQTLYVLYFPAGTILRLDGISACAPPGTTGWHDTVSVTVGDAGASVDVAYAVLPRCASDPGAMTQAASHEIVESATDPSPENAPAIQMTDPAWLAFGPEVADVCVATDTNLSTTDSGYVLQRSWSNASARGGHDPCVPRPAGSVYFNMAPAMGAEELTLGVGETATFALYALADGDAGSWQLQALATNGSTSVALSLDRTTVQAGETALLTVTLQSQPTLGPTELYGVVSQTTSDTHLWPMLIQAR
jgi:hypothetical protein